MPQHGESLQLNKNAPWTGMEVNRFLPNCFDTEGEKHINLWAPNLIFHLSYSLQGTLFLVHQPDKNIFSLRFWRSKSLIFQFPAVMELADTCLFYDGCKGLLHCWFNPQGHIRGAGPWMLLDVDCPPLTRHETSHWTVLFVAAVDCTSVDRGRVTEKQTQEGRANPRGAELERDLKKKRNERMP